MRRGRIAWTWLIAVLCGVAAVLAQPAAGIDAAALRSLAVAAVSSASGDDTVALRSLDEEVKAHWGDVLVDPISVSDAPTEIHLFSPYAAYRKSIAELMRRHQSIERLPFSPIGIVLVAPVRVDAPDVTNVELRRDGKNVSPIANELVLRPITSPVGVTLNLHAGYVAFPLAAFAPGGEVVVTAVRDSGSNLTLTLDAAMLARFR